MFKFKKGMGVVMGVVGILSLAGAAAAGDLMQWSPRTPAGGGSPGFLGSYLSQAAAVEYGPAAVVNRDIGAESHQDNVLEYSNFGTTRVRYLDEDGNLTSANEAATTEQSSEQQTVQKQKSVIYSVR
jgi:hypothetical protein